MTVDVQIARSVGVNVDDIEDVLQEARIRQWRSPGVPFRVLVKRASVDWMRHHGPHSRAGTKRLHVSDWAVTCEAPYHVVDRVLDFYRAWWQLTPTQRRWIRLSANGLTNNYERVYQSRQYLRRYMEAA